MRERKDAPTATSATAGAAPAPGPSGGVVTRRQVPSDNSCLFRAVSYVMERTEERHGDLRRVVADAIRADPARFSEAFLGRANSEYCRWILEASSWGGAIELAVLSEHYRWVVGDGAALPRAPAGRGALGR